MAHGSFPAPLAGKTRKGQMPLAWCRMALATGEKDIWAMQPARQPGSAISTSPWPTRSSGHRAGPPGTRPGRLFSAVSDVRPVISVCASSGEDTAWRQNLPAAARASGSPLRAGCSEPAQTMSTGCRRGACSAQSTTTDEGPTLPGCMKPVSLGRSALAGLTI